MSNQKIVAICGLAGSGKSEVSDQFIKAGLEHNEENERPIRERFRKKHGMAAFAILNMSKIDEILNRGGNVLADGLYSWSEYKELKDKYGEQLIVVAVYAAPEIRYTRLADRRSRYKDDLKMKYRSFSRDEAKSRDYAEIENIEKAGPIAMANYTIINEGGLEELEKQVEEVLVRINKN